MICFVCTFDMAKIKIVLLFWTIYIQTTIQQETICTNTSSKFSSKYRTLSNLSCVNKGKELSFRECSNGYWRQEPECHFVQSENPPQCPGGFTDSSQPNMCYKISNDKSKFPPKCPFEDVLPFNYYKDVIDNVGPVWMPVRRDLSNGLGFLQWIEASSLYKSEFKSESLFWATIKDKDCVLYYNSSYMEAVSCEEEHFSVCAYKKLDQLTDQVCDSENFCHQSDFTAKSKCFCLGVTAQRQSDPKVEFLKPYQNNIYKKLTNETCSMGLEKTPNGTYIWSSSKQEIDYTYWSPDAVFNKTFIYGASTPKGWVLTQEPASCCLFEKEVEKLEPELTSTFDEYTYHLELTVTNFRGLKWVNSEVLLYCFTDANAENLLYRYPALNQKLRTNDTVVYDFKLNDDGPGRYWCESFRNLDLEVVKSNEFFFRESTIFYYEFVMILRVNYSQTLIHLNPLSSDIIEYLREFFDEMNSVSHLKDNYVTRFMKIIDIDEMQNEVLINIHLTYNIDGSNNNHDGEYEFTKTLIQEAIQRTVGIKLEMVDFLSSDYCLKKIDQKQTWPTTEVGRLAHSEEFCFKIDTSLVTSLCDGNFISGARWSISEEKCEIFNKSSVTPQLLPLIDQQPGSEAAMVIFDISTNHDLIYPFDVYAISEIFSKMFAIYRGDYITTFIETISNLMEIKRHVLLEARLKMNATDKILAIIDHIAAYSGENTEVCTKNLCFKFETFHDWAGFGVPKGNTSRLMSISSNQTVDDIKNMNLDIGVWLSSPVLSQLEASPSLVILFFFKGSFFVENSTTDKSLSTVGRIILPYIEEPLAGPIWVFQDVEDEITKACSFWNFDLLGFWQKDSDSFGHSSYQFCEFWRPSFFVLTDGNQDNMTESLIGILESNFKTPEVINRLHRLSRRHEEFGYIDVYLVGKILEKVHQDSGIDLKALVETVSNLHQVQRKILEESQNLKWATDTILHYVDQILMNHNYDKQVNVTSDNFIILISDIKESNFSGLAFLGYNKTFQMQILEGDTEIEEVANYENLISAVVLSSELKKQLEEDAKVIVTFFPNDALFNENTTQSKDVSKIFGVTLPNIAKYSGPISVLHKATKSYYQNQCSYWYYNQSTAGLWLDDSESKYLSSVINCEFWHATHFALLLLDQDKFHDNALDWITNINCAISMVSLFCIILTAILFKKWRRNTGNQILLNFVFVIILQIGLLYVSGIINQNSQDDVLCTVTGLVLHYSVISEFCWMLVISFLQYKRFVKILEGSPKRILFKACLCGWILPLLPVISVYVLYPDSYTHSKVRLCYPSGAGLYLGVWLPLSIIISVNFIVFGYVMYSVVYKKTECDNVGNNEILLHWRLGVLLFFLLGLTWIFGFMGQLGFGIAFVYLFCITATLQGFMLFLFFIVFNSNAKFLYTRAFKMCFHKGYWQKNYLF